MQAAPQRAPPPPPLLECKASGTLEDARVPALMQLLRALDPRPPVALLEQEVLAAQCLAQGLVSNCCWRCSYVLRCFYVLPNGAPVWLLHQEGRACLALSRVLGASSSHEHT